jgi:trimeric autotransporter adhesin
MREISTTRQASAVTSRDRRHDAWMAALCAALVLAALATASGVFIVASAAASPTTVTLGSTAGTASANICGAMTNCTYVPFTSVANPGLAVPFDGTVTSFSVNAGSAGGAVELRVLAPAGSGQYTGAGTSPAETLAAGMNTFSVSMPVKSGDVLGLDNATSALIFDSSQTTPITAFYESPSLADGTTAAPNQTMTGLRLLLSATVQESSAATSSSTTTATSTTTVTTTTTATTTQQAQAPRISHASMSATRFRVAPAAASASARVPLGTTFRFTLSAAASMQIAITQSVTGVRVGHRCVAPTGHSSNTHASGCTRTVAVGALAPAPESRGVGRLRFTGRIGRRALGAGAYRAVLRARNAGGRSRPVTLGFSVVAP